RQAIADAPTGSTLTLTGSNYAVAPTFGDAEQPIGLTIAHKELEIRGKPDAPPPRIVFETTAEIGDALLEINREASLALFTVMNGRLSLERLRVTLKSSSNDTAPLRAVVLEGGEVRVRGCWLETDGPPPLRGSAAIAAGHRLSTGANSVHVERTLFTGGTNALRIERYPTTTSVSRVVVRHCFVQPMDSAFDFVDKGPLDVVVDRVSLLAGRGPVFKFSEAADAKCQVAGTIVSRSPAERSRALVAVELLPGASKTKEVGWFESRGNFLHGFADDGLMSVAEQPVLLAPTALVEYGFLDKGSTILPADRLRLWAADDPFQPTPAGGSPINVFQFAPQALAALPRGADGDFVGGGPAGPFGPLRPPAPPPTAPSPADAVEPKSATPPAPDGSAATPFRVEPDAVDGRRPGVFSRLSLALAAIAETPGPHVVELRTNGSLVESKLRIDRKDVTVRAADGFRPTVRLAEGSSFLFETAAGSRLRVIGLTLEVDGPATGSPAAVFDVEPGGAVELAAVAVAGGRTIDTGELAVFRVRPPARSSAGSAMPVMQDRPATELTARLCEFRLNGSLFSAPPAAAWTLKVGESLVVARKAPTLRIEGEGGAVDAGVNRFVVEDSTFVVDGPLVALAATGAAADPPRNVEVESNRCAVLSLDANPMTRSTGRHSALFQRDSIRWKGSNNFLAGFNVLFDYTGDGADGSFRVPLSREA
ncbi:MAG: hypothetical protein ACRC1K_17230, partial [Planctomycetia bacterium]